MSVVAAAENLAPGTFLAIVAVLRSPGQPSAR
jgi:hypothetical protein